jgi:formate C-acetyltransferase
MSHNIRPESNLLGNFYLRFEGSEPVTLGGLTPQGEDATNDLTYLLLDAAERSRAVTNVVLRLHRNTPQKLHLALAGALYRGASNISVMNDEVQVEALKGRGVEDPDARNYAVTGCTDVICPGKTGGLSISGLMLCRVLDITIRGGTLQTLAGPVENAGPSTGDPDAFACFEQFLDAFQAQAEYSMEKIVEASNIRDRIFAEFLPAPYVSAFIQGCLDTRRDVTRGGAVYDMSLINMINSVANLVDALLVIQKLVFQEKVLTFAQLRRAMDDNFSGYPEIERMIRNVKDRWGNAHRETDELARSVTARLFEASTRHRAFRNAPWGAVINSMTSHTIDGRLSTASPDGRRAATPYASSCNPYNVEKNGITSVLQSVASMDFRNVLGCSVNIRLHPSAIGRTEETRTKWAHLLRTFFRLGGPQLQPTVASAELLRAAQREPESHGGLVVKVGGYSAYFTELGREIQDEIITRTEHTGI